MPGEISRSRAMVQCKIRLSLWGHSRAAGSNPVRWLRGCAVRIGETSWKNGFLRLPSVTRSTGRSDSGLSFSAKCVIPHQARGNSSSSTRKSRSLVVGLDFGAVRVRSKPHRAPEFDSASFWKTRPVSLYTAWQLRIAMRCARAECGEQILRSSAPKLKMRIILVTS